MGSPIVIEEDHLLAICQEYCRGIAGIQEAIAATKATRGFLESNYEGQGTPHVLDVLDKLSEHLSLLGKCADALLSFVAVTLEEMTEADESLAAG